MEEYRNPPCDIEVEMSILGAMMTDDIAADKGIELLRADDFYRDNNRLVFGAMLSLTKDFKPIDINLVADELRKSGQLERVGGLSYLGTLLTSVVTSSNIVYHAELIRDKAKLRNLIHISSDSISRAYAEDGNASEILDWSAGRIFDANERNLTGGFKGISEIIPSVYDTIDAARIGTTGTTGYSYGFSQMDNITGGIHDEYIIIAARPSMGKTCLATDIAMNVAEASGKTVALFSMEMVRDEIVMRMISKESRCNLHRLRTGGISKNDMQNISKIIVPLSKLPVYIDDEVSHTPMSLLSRARRLKKDHDLGMIVIDYIQLLKHQGRAENRNQEVTEISREIKHLGRELRVPVVALSQLSRKVEERQDKRPSLADLRESGSLEQDADVVWFIHRPEYYQEKSIYINNRKCSSENIAEIICAKQRNGPTASVFLNFQKDFVSFYNLDLESIEGMGEESFDGRRHQYVD